MQEWGNAKLKNLPSKQLLSTYWEFRPIITSYYIIVIHCVDFLQTHHPSWRIDWLIDWVWPLLVFPSIPNAFLKPRGLTMDPLDSIRRLILRLPIRSFKTSVQPGWPATSLRHHQGAREISGHLAQHGLPLTPVVPFSLQFWKKQVWWPRVKLIQSHTVGLTAFQHMPQLWLSFFEKAARKGLGYHLLPSHWEPIGSCLAQILIPLQLPAAASWLYSEATRVQALPLQNSWDQGNPGIPWLGNHRALNILINHH